VLLLVSFGSFFLLDLVPGDPAATVLGPEASPADIARVHTELGLDKPLFSRYVSWIHDVASGDLGRSVYPPKREVASLIAQRLPVTIEIALLSLALSLIVSVPVALRAAYRPGDRFDRWTTGLAFGSISIPVFLAGLLVAYFFVFPRTLVQVLILAVGAGAAVAFAMGRWRRARDLSSGDPDRGRVLMILGVGTVAILGMTILVTLRWPEFPRQGFVRLTDGGLGPNLRSVALPVLTLSLTECAVFTRLLRSDLISTLGEDFILSARAKGMPAWRVMVGDALRPSSFSLIALVGVSLGRVIGGTVIVENIFNIPGMGRLLVNSITVKDYPVVQAAVLMLAVLYVLSSAAVDVLSAYLDPRIRRGRV
jgi:peptide/nickel transport system permease protein